MNVTLDLPFGCELERPELALQLSILLLQLLRSHLDIFHLLRGSDGQFLDDLDKAPETQNDDERRDFLHSTTRQGIDEETSDDDQGIKDVEPGAEVPY